MPGCTCGKVWYPTRRRAKRSARRLARRDRAAGLDKPWPTNAYRCPDGPGWHVGHLPVALLVARYAPAAVNAIFEATTYWRPAAVNSPDTEEASTA